MEEAESRTERQAEGHREDHGHVPAEDQPRQQAGPRPPQPVPGGEAAVGPGCAGQSSTTTPCTSVTGTGASSQGLSRVSGRPGTSTGAPSSSKRTVYTRRARTG